MKKILITGATGYNGFKIAEKMSLENKVTLLLRANSKNFYRIEPIKERVSLFEYSSYSSFPDFFKENYFDCIIHLATTNRNGSWQESLESNIIFSTNLVEAYSNSCSSPCFINTSPYSAYNSEGNYYPNSLYDATKKAFEDILEYYRIQKNLNVITLNLYDVYGLDDWRGKIFSILLDSFKNDKPLKLTQGKEYLNHLYIKDVISAYEAALNLITNPDYKDHKKYNIFSNETISLKETVEIMEYVLGKKIEIEWGAFPYPKGRMIEKPFMGNDILPNWQPQFTIEKVLKEEYL